MRNRGEALAEFALRLRGAPYRYGGATLDGFDCSGLVFYAHRHLGLTVPRTLARPGRRGREHQAAQTQAR